MSDFLITGGLLSDTRLFNILFDAKLQRKMQIAITEYELDSDCATKEAEKKNYDRMNEFLAYKHADASKILKYALVMNGIAKNSNTKILNGFVRKNMLTDIYGLADEFVSWYNRGGDDLFGRFETIG